jgi:hypothetical protein
MSPIRTRPSRAPGRAPNDPLTSGRWEECVRSAARESCHRFLMSFIVKKKPRQLEVRSVMVLKAGCELAFPDRKSRFFTTMLGVTNVTLTMTNVSGAVTFQPGRNGVTSIDVSKP